MPPVAFKPVHVTLPLTEALPVCVQELTLRQEMSDLKGESRAHGHLGAVHMSLGNYTNAIKCYQEQLDRAKELKDSYVEAQAFGNLGIARLNMGHYEDAIGYLEQQLATLQQVSSPTALLDKVSNILPLPFVKLIFRRGYPLTNSMVIVVLISEDCYKSGKSEKTCFCQGTPGNVREIVPISVNVGQSWEKIYYMLIME